MLRLELFTISEPLNARTSTTCDLATSRHFYEKWKTA
jgi:hypothetical protein